MRTAKAPAWAVTVAVRKVDVVVQTTRVPVRTAIAALLAVTADVQADIFFILLVEFQKKIQFLVPYGFPISSLLSEIFQIVYLDLSGCAPF